MDDQQRIAGLFRAIDRKDAKTFATFLAPGCVFRFGNGPAVAGQANVEAFVAGFFDSIAELSHEVLDVWDVPGGKVCHGNVTYTRKDRSVLTVPFANVFRMSGDGIAEYLIFADTSQLYAAR